MVLIWDTSAGWRRVVERLRRADAAAIVRVRRTAPRLHKPSRSGPCLQIVCLYFWFSRCSCPLPSPWRRTPPSACGSQKNVPAAKRVTNTARWTTASETDNFGYDVYRGDSEKGPFIKLTKQPILGNGTTEETHKYKFVDDTIDPCKDYWYYVE